LIIVAIVAALVLIAGTLFVVTRNGDGDSTATSATTDSTTGADDGGQPAPAGKPNADLSNEMPSPDITLTDDVVVVDSKQGAMFKGFSDDGTGMLIDASAPGVDKLEAGKILLLSGITVVRVDAVDRTDEGVSITGSSVTLPEVIADGDLAWTDVAYDPDKMRLRVWQPSGDDSSSSSNPSSGSAGGGSGSGDLPTDDSIVDDGGAGIIDGLGGASLRPSDGTIVATPVAQVSGPLTGSASTYALPKKAVSGSVGGFSFDLNYEPEGSGHHLKLDLTSSGDLDGTITVDTHLGALATSGGAKVDGRQVRNFDFSFSELGGEATIETNLRSTKQLTSVMTPPFLKVPFSLEFPALVGGIPFTLSLTGTIQVQLSMALAGAGLSGQAKISFGGDAGLKFDGGSLSVNGVRQQDAENLINTVKGLSSGPVGVVVTAELPKVGFGFGFLQTGAGAYLSNGSVVAQSVLPPPPACTGLQVAYVLAAGVEAKFLGKEFDLGRKAVVDKRWDYTVPQTQQCRPELR
jgi:hypothetical protein